MIFRFKQEVQAVKNVPSKKERKILTKKLDKIVSKIIVLRDGGCVLCGFDCCTEKKPTPRGSIKTNGHVFSRNSRNTRWDISPDGNCHCQCWACNYRHVTDQYPYFEWYKKKFGQEKFDELRARSKKSYKWTIQELKDYLEILNSLYALMLAKKDCGQEVNEIRLLDDKIKKL